MSFDQTPPSHPLVSRVCLTPTSTASCSEDLPSGSPERGIAITHVIEIDPQTDSRWEAFVAAHPDGLIYHHPRWLQVIEKAHGHKPVCFACEDAEGQICGVLPLFHTRGLITGHRLLSLPHTPVAGPLAYDDQSTAALVHAALEWVYRKPGVRLQLKVLGAGLDGLAHGMVGLPWAVTYMRELPEQPEKVYFGNSRHHAAIKRAVNKATKMGVQVRPAETETELRDWYELYLETMRSHAVPPRPYRFFKVAWELLRPYGLMRLLLAEQHEAGQSRLLAGSIFLMFGQTVFYAFNGRRHEDLDKRPNDIIQWQAIYDACRDGFRRFDLGEVAVNQRGLAEFKSKWGSEPRWLYRYYYPAPRVLEAGILKSDSYIHQLASAAWPWLPLKVTTLLGNWLYSSF